MLVALLAHAPAFGQVFHAPGGVRAGHTGKVDLSGNEFIYDARSDTFIARGNARLKQASTLLQADVMEFDRRTQKLSATGDVSLSDPDIDMTASRAELNAEDETGELQDAKITVKRGNYSLAGKAITKLLGQHYHVRDGYFTTCGCERGTPSWSIAGRDMDVTLGGRAVVKDARFKILDHTVLDVPYAFFPADTERQSGFLSPLLGQSRLRGFQYFQPYYIDINRSSDATVAVDLETSARVGGMAEYRLQNGVDDYLRVTGGFFDESIRDNRRNDIVDGQIADPHVPVDRYGLIGLMRQHINPDLVVWADGNTVSDSLYLREMDVYTLSRGYGSNFGLLRTANSDFGAQQSFENSFLRLDGFWIQDLIQPQQFALQTLPELVWSGRQNLGLGGLRLGSVNLGSPYADYDFQAINYYRQQGVDGSRYDLHPRLTLPWRWQDYLSGWATAGARETVYDVSGHKLGVVPVGFFDPTIGKTRLNNNGLFLDGLNPGGMRHREILDASVGLTSRIEKVYDVNRYSIEKLKHTIEPLVSYDYVPVVDQGALPIFDDTDRLEPRSLLSYGLVSRLYAKFGAQEGAPALNESSSNDAENPRAIPPAVQSAQPNGGRVRELAEFSLLHMYDARHALTPSGVHFSDISAAATVFPTTYLSFGEFTDFNPNSKQLAGETLSLALRPPWVKPTAPQQARLDRAFIGGPYVQFSYSFIGGRNAVHQFSARAYYEFFDRIGLYYAPAYDIADGRMQYTEYGLRLKSKCDCWIADFGVNNSINPSEVQFVFQLTLGGVGSIGRSPFARNILLSNPYGSSRGPWE